MLKKVLKDQQKTEKSESTDTHPSASSEDHATITSTPLTSSAADPTAIEKPADLHFEKIISDLNSEKSHLQEQLARVTEDIEMLRASHSTLSDQLRAALASEQIALERAETTESEMSARVQQSSLECESLREKLDSLEKMNLKLKAKLKLMLKDQKDHLQQQQQQQRSDSPSLLTVATTAVENVSPVTTMILNQSSPPINDHLETENKSLVETNERLQDQVNTMRAECERSRQSNEELSMIRDELKANMAELLERLERVETEKRSVERELDELRAASEQWSHERASLESELAAKVTQVEQLNARSIESLDRLVVENGRLVEQVQAFEMELNDKRAQIGKLGEMARRVGELERVLDDKCRENESLIEKLNKLQGK